MAERIPGRRVVAAAADGVLWPQLRHCLGARLMHDPMPSGFAAAVADEWLRLDRSRLSAATRIDSLVAFCASAGADAGAVLDRERERLARSSPTEFERRERAAVGRRARLEITPLSTTRGHRP